MGKHGGKDDPIEGDGQQKGRPVPPAPKDPKKPDKKGARRTCV